MSWCLVGSEMCIRDSADYSLWILSALVVAASVWAAGGLR
jgi:hypothetical protein